MNKRYIDFVPREGTKPAPKKVERVLPEQRQAVSAQENWAGPAQMGRTEPTSARRAAPTQVKRTPAHRVASGAREVARAQRPVAKTEVVETRQETVAFGVVEDYKPKFLKTEVKKRSLGAMPRATAEGAAASAGKAAKAGGMSAGRTGSASAEKATKKSIVSAAMPAMKPAASKSAVRKSPFVNTEKITKRPLSKNVYPKKVVVPKKEEPSGLVRIISKPEKDSKAGMIVAIIITIILGAAAGTVAFLLLPK